MMNRSAAVIGMVATSLMAVTTPSAHAQPSDYQYVRTESGKVRCVISAGNAACERTSAGGFPDAPPSQLGGGHWNIAEVDASGDFRWLEGNIGGADIDQDVVLVYAQTYRFNGWTIVSTFDGTRLTNDGSGRGMFVAIDGVSSF
jgi:hypothetical protein